MSDHMNEPSSPRCKRTIWYFWNGLESAVTCQELDQKSSPRQVYTHSSYRKDNLVKFGNLLQSAWWLISHGILMCCDIPIGKGWHSPLQTSTIRWFWIDSFMKSRYTTFCTQTSQVLVLSAASKHLSCCNEEYRSHAKELFGSAK